MSEGWPELAQRAESLIARLERALGTAPPAEPDWSATAHRWRPGSGLQAIHTPDAVALDSLLHIEHQRDALLGNTRAFLAGRPANNALLWGARGTGKSSLVKALLPAFAADGLRLIEVEPADLIALPEITDALRDRPERFILFVDDLSFEAGDASYKALKAMLDGSLLAAPDHVLVYATSNRRHLMPEPQSDNEMASIIDGEIHPGEAVEEKISLSDRFGLWLAFHRFSQDDYLHIVEQHLKALGCTDTGAARDAALQWATARGTRSGRTALHFARHWMGHDRTR